MPKTNVLYLIRTWALGGSHTIILLLLKHLPADEFNIITVPYDAPGDGDARFIASVEAQGGSVAPERIPWRSRGNWFNARRTIGELIEKYEIDLVHCHDTHSNVLVGLGRKRWPCACIASPYGWWEPKWHLQARLYHWVEKKKALPQFDRVYTVSQDMKQKILAGPTRPERIHVIHTGLDLAQIDAGAPRDTVRRDLGFDTDAMAAGTVSRLEREKGHTHLLHAFAKVTCDLRNLHLLIVGTGSEADELKRTAQRLGVADRTIFTGFYDDLPGALHAMDCFVQPSIDHEGFPTAVLEAQAAGLPVIASNIGGTHETMADGTTGLLVPPGDADALAEALRALATDPVRRSEMAAAARAHIENRFTLDKMIGQMTEMYHAAIEDHRKRR